jgi:hypothetical protein
VGIPLKIAAKVDKVDEAYFRTEILPLVDGKGSNSWGEINEREKTTFLGDAAALLFPIDWPGAVWFGHDRSDGMRYAGAGVSLWISARDSRGWRHQSGRK